MSKLVGIRTYERFRSLWEDNAIDEFSLNFIIDTGLLYTHGIFINGAVFGTAANGAVPLSIAGITNTLALSTHTHSNYLEKNADIDISSYKIKSGDKDLLFYSGGSLYLGNTTSPTYISGNNLYSVRGTNVYEILDTSNFSVSNTLPTGYTYNNTAYIRYGNNSHQIDYVKRINTSLSFDYLNTYTLAGTNLLNGVQYGYITLYTDNVYTNPSWAQLRINIPGKSIQYRTSADANTWINLDQPNIPLNALNVAGIVSAPSSTTTNKVWKTDGSGNPAWRDELSYTFSNLKFLLISGTDLMTYNTLAVRTILAGSNVSFTHDNGVLTINAQSPTYGVVSKTLAGLAPQLPNETTTTKFLRQDGTWATPTYTSDTNTWREIKVNGTQKRGTAITSGDLNFINGSNTTVEWTSDNKLKINSTWTAWKGATDSANGTAGYMPAPTSALRGQFLRGDGSWVSLNNYSLPTASNSTLGGVKTGAAIADTTGYTAVAIKDGIIYYKDTNTTYSFSNLLFLLTSGTNLMTYNSQAVRTVLAGSNITFTHNNNILTIAAKDTTYSTVSKTAAGLCPILPNETTTTKYLRLDGSWVTPPDNNTWKAANASQEGYVPKSTANKILRANGDGALYWGDDANTTYTFYNLQFQNSGGTTVDTYKPTTSPTKTLKAGSNVTISAASNVITIASTDTNTWRGILNNLTSSSNTTESLSAKQGYLLANGSARDNTKLPLAGGTMVGTISAANDAYGGGGFNNGYANIILRGNTTTGTSGIVFSSSKGDTSINRPSDCAFIQFLPYGVAAATAVGTNPTINTSGESGKFVIGIHNDSGDQLWLQTSAVNDLKHVVGANVYTIYDSGNLPAYPTKSSWNYNDMYVASVSISGNNLRINKNGANTDLTIPYATSASNSTKARYVEGDNDAASPGGALLRSGAGRADASPAGDTWIYWDTLGGTSSYWGIRHNQAANTIGFCGSGTERVTIHMGESKVTATTFAGNCTGSAGSVAWSNVSSKPATATRWPSWSEVTGKPSTFSPSSHTHNYMPWNNVSSLNANDASPGWYNSKASITNAAHTNHSSLLYVNNVGTPYQLLIPDSSVLYIYKRWYTSGAWSNWSKISAGYADSAGNADTVDSLHFKWSNDSNSPTYLWAANSSGTAFLCARGSMSVNYANYSGYAGYLTLTYCNSSTNSGLWNTIKNGSSNTVTNKVNFYTIYNNGGPTTYGEMLEILSYNANHWLPLLWFGAGKSGHMYYRNKNYNDNSWGNWLTILDSDNSSVSKSGLTLTVKINGTSQSLTNTTYSGSSTVTLSGTTFSLTKANVTTALGYTPPTTNSTYNFSGTTFYSGNSGTAEHNCNNAVKNGNYYYTSNGPSGLGNSTSDGALYVQSYSDSWVGQIAQDYRNGRLWVRGRNNGTWQSWVRIANYNEIPSTIAWGSVTGKPTLLGAINYNNNSNSTYQVLWGSGNACYGTAGIYVNPYYNYVYATTFYTTSDRSKKQDISEFSEHIRKFLMKDTKTWHYGVIAQEVPEIFRDGEEGNMTVNYSSILSYYVGCLENKVKELEEKIKVLETKLNKLI